MSDEERVVDTLKRLKLDPDHINEHFYYMEDVPVTDTVLVKVKGKEEGK